jgi:hypothetical protein
VEVALGQTCARQACDIDRDLNVHALRILWLEVHDLLTRMMCVQGQIRRERNFLTSDILMVLQASSVKEDMMGWTLYS